MVAPLPASPLPTPSTALALHPALPPHWEEPDAAPGLSPQQQPALTPCTDPGGTCSHGSPEVACSGESCPPTHPTDKLVVAPSQPHSLTAGASICASFSSPPLSPQHQQGAAFQSAIGKWISIGGHGLLITADMAFWPSVSAHKTLLVHPCFLHLVMQHTSPLQISSPESIFELLLFWRYGSVVKHCTDLVDTKISQILPIVPWPLKMVAIKLLFQQLGLMTALSNPGMF